MADQFHLQGCKPGNKAGVGRQLTHCNGTIWTGKMGSVVKNPPTNAGDTGSIPGLG